MKTNCNIWDYWMTMTITNIMRLPFILILILIFLQPSFNNPSGSDVTATKDNNQVNPLQQKDPVFIMYAGSLLKTFEEIFGPAFQMATSYTYEGEGRGSVQISNMIIDGLRRPDIFISAGTLPLMKLMNNTTPLAEWLVKFSSAEMVIAYSNMSRSFKDLEKARVGEIPWFEVLSKPDFRFGRTDPELDPKGYYMVITAGLANIYYNDSGIKDRVVGDDRNPKQIFPEEILKTILEQGQLDAVAAYKHEAIARGLPFITLPAEINLAHPIFSEYYKRASYALENSEGLTVFGEPIYFSFTIPNIVNNLDGAISFASFILSTEGKKILEEEGLHPIRPVIEGNMNKVHPGIRDILDEK